MNKRKLALIVPSMIPCLLAVILLLARTAIAQDLPEGADAHTEEATGRLLDLCAPLFSIAALIGVALTIFGLFIRNYKLSASGIIAASVFITLYWSKSYGLLGIGVGALLILMRSPGALEEDDPTLQPHRDALGRTIRKPPTSKPTKESAVNDSADLPATGSGLDGKTSSSEPRAFKESPFIGKLNRP